MVLNQLRFARTRLFFLALASVGAAVALVGIGLDLGPDDRVRRLSFLLLFGKGAIRTFFFVSAVLLLVTALAALRRLVGDRPAAAIRHDGIELNGLYLSRYIPWRMIDRIWLRTFRMNGSIYHYIRIESRCPASANPLHHFLASLSYGVPGQLIAATVEDLAIWIERARAAWHEDARPRPTPVQRPRPGFGRRAA